MLVTHPKRPTCAVAVGEAWQTLQLSGQPADRRGREQKRSSRVAIDSAARLGRPTWDGGRRHGHPGHTAGLGAGFGLALLGSALVSAPALRPPHVRRSRPDPRAARSAAPRETERARPVRRWRRARDPGLARRRLDHPGHLPEAADLRGRGRRGVGGAAGSARRRSAPVAGSRGARPASGSSRQTATGWSRPRSCCASAGRSPTSAGAAAGALPGGLDQRIAHHQRGYRASRVSCSSRLATLTTSPSTANSSRRSEPMSPSTTSP